MIVNRYEFAEAPVELIERLAENYFFSSSGFAGLWRAMGGRPVYWIAEENGSPIAILPGVEFGKGIFRRFQAMPNGCYARVLFTDDYGLEGPVSTILLFTRILQENYLRVFISDFYRSFNITGGVEIKSHATHIVDISSRDWEPPDQKLRQQIHKAEREELVVEKFDNAKHIDGFLNLVKLHEKRRLTKSRYTPEFFEALAELSLVDTRIKWIWCESDHEPVSSHIFFREGDSLLHWQMYYDESKSHLQATKLIPYRAAKEATNEGIKHLNLGASPPHAEGAEFYKSKWGGEVVQYNCYEHKSFLGNFF